MNKTDLNGTRDIQTGLQTNQYATLTDNNLRFEKGQKDEMSDKVQIKLGTTKEELDAILKSL